MTQKTTNILAQGIAAQAKVAQGKALTEKETEAYRSMANGKTEISLRSETR